LNKKIVIVGLGYVGLPLAYEFSKHYNVIGYDIDNSLIDSLNNNIDSKEYYTQKELKNCNAKFSKNSLDLDGADIFIITVPTPVTKNKKPDLTPLINATKLISKFIKKKNLIIYESTMYPGLTDEILIPLIEKKSKLKINNDFLVGYSPERVSPGDSKRNLTNIKKIVSGSNIKAKQQVSKIYKKIIKAGIYSAKSIKVAEAAKILENMQRDINISLINEVSIIFNKLKINTFDVLDAAKTKWNFIDLKPGLVGGHCISVDPYYMKYKSEKIGYKPKVISSGRSVNEKMAKNLCQRVLNELLKNKKNLKNCNIGLMGLTFKENCNDIRNSQSFKIINFFQNKKIKINIIDPYIEKININNKNIKKILVKKFDKKMDCIIITVPHRQFLKLKGDFFVKNLNKNGVIFDVKNTLKNKRISNINILTF
jgi:UDP-N-acetyl-D-glucosamine/UDP-N-acetyl-D-galactosamine dehydrogenase